MQRVAQQIILATSLKKAALLARNERERPHTGT